MDEDKQRRRKEWAIEQRLNRKHEEKKLWMIKKYEEERSRHHDFKELLQRDENMEEQRSIRIQSENSRNITIDEKELCLTKVEIQQNILKRKKRNSNNMDKIILPRRNGEGHRPLFDREEIKTASQSRIGELQTVMNHDQSGKTSSVKKSSSLPRKNYADIKASHCHRTQKSSSHHDDATKNDKHRRSHRSQSNERHVYMEKERNRSSSERASSFTRHESSYRRSRSSPPNNKYANERYMSDDRSRSSFKRDYYKRFREPNNRISMNNIQGNIGLNSGHNFGIGHSEYNKYNSEYNKYGNNPEYNKYGNNPEYNYGNNSGNQTAFYAPTSNQRYVHNVINHYHIMSPMADPWRPPSFPMIGPFIAAGPSSAPGFFPASADFPSSFVPSGQYLAPESFPTAESLTMLEPPAPLYFRSDLHAGRPASHGN